VAYDDNSNEDGSNEKKARIKTGKCDPILDYIEAKRNDERELAARNLSLEERRLALEEKKLESERIERDRYWKNAEEERKLQLEKLKNESRDKELFFGLLKELKK